MLPTLRLTCAATERTWVDARHSLCQTCSGIWSVHETGISKLHNLTDSATSFNICNMPELPIKADNDPKRKLSGMCGPHKNTFTTKLSPGKISAILIIFDPCSSVTSHCYCDFGTCRWCIGLRLVWGGTGGSRCMQNVKDRSGRIRCLGCCMLSSSSEQRC